MLVRVRLSEPAPCRSRGVSIGQALSAARLDAGLSVDDISAKTRLRATVIRAIEADDFSLCGGDFYARGHIRTLAGLVGLDPVPLLAEYDATIASEDDGPATSQLYETEVTGRAITRTAQKRSPHWGLAAVAAALVAIIVFATSGLLNHKQEATPRRPPPAAAADDDAAGRRRNRQARRRPSSPPGLRPDADRARSRPRAPWWPKPACTWSLRITTAKCWVAATASDGQALYQGVLNPGDTKTFDDPQRDHASARQRARDRHHRQRRRHRRPATKNSVTSVSFGPGNPLLAQG